jgi:drug/metabolite transporter (DMT)-like permease
VSVWILRNREDLTPRTLVGACLVLAGIALLAIR